MNTFLFMLVLCCFPATCSDIELSMRYQRCRFENIFDFESNSMFRKKKIKKNTVDKMPIVDTLSQYTFFNMSETPSIFSN